MNKKEFWLIIFLLILVGFLSKHLYHTEHTQIEILSLEYRKNCSPEIVVEVKKLGVENVISSCLLRKEEATEINCTYGKLNSHLIKLRSACLNSSGEIHWILALYGKHTLSEVPKIELINKTLE